MLKVKLHVDHPYAWESKVIFNGQGHVTKMAAMPIYGKNVEKISGTGGLISTKLYVASGSLAYHSLYKS